MTRETILNSVNFLMIMLFKGWVGDRERESSEHVWKWYVSNSEKLLCSAMKNKIVIVGYVESILFFIRAETFDRYYYCCKVSLFVMEWMLMDSWVINGIAFCACKRIKTIIETTKKKIVDIKHSNDHSSNLEFRLQMNSTNLRKIFFFTLASFVLPFHSHRFSEFKCSSLFAICVKDINDLEESNARERERDLKPNVCCYSF